MAEHSGTNDFSLPLEAKERIDRVCWAFEQAWQSGDRPRIEEFLANARGPERSALLTELLLLDIDYRQRAGQRPTAEEYHGQFPGDESLIESVFQRSQTSVAGAALLAPPADSLLGSRIGPYKLLSVLGEGGFGIVYLAQQEQPIRRQVALKILKPGMDTRQVLARFEAERHTLALMDHTNIARVFDAGMNDGGRSYFVMELVQGRPITAYCDAQKLALRERLELFLTVCQAVQHAHQKGIIHRDIKPTNILIAVTDGQPVPKIIDFGLAKAMARPLTEGSIFTHEGQLLGTPEYMSPEQAGANPLDVDSRSDIYSLGVLLYELLTGTLPFERRILREAGFEEICRIIREVEPPRPSARISSLGGDSQDMADNRQADPSSLHKQLRHELDWIVMKALEKDRTRRYAAASALAEDIEHYLAGEPVHAGPPGNWYRARKFAQRFRGPLAVAGGFVALLVAITIMAVRGYYREAKLSSDADTARLQAENAAKKAQANFQMALDAVKKYYTEVAADSRLKAHGLEKLRRDLLKSANDYYETLTRQAADDPRLQDDRLWALIERGDIERAVGNWSAAEAAYNKAIAVATQLIQTHGGESEYQNDLASVHNNLGALYMTSGRTAEAEAAYKRAIAQVKTLVSKYPEKLLYQKDLADSYHNLGVLCAVTGRLNEAVAAHREALVLRKVLAKTKPDSSDYQDLLAASYDTLGSLYQQLNQPKEALSHKQEAIAIQKALVEKHPDDPEYQNDLAGIYSNLAMLHVAGGRANEAEAEHKEACAIWKTLVENHPDVPEYQYHLAGSYHELGALFRATGRTQQSDEANQRAFVLWKALVAKHPEVPEYQGRLAASCYNRGNSHLAAGRNQEAEAAYKEAIDILKRLVEVHPEMPADQFRLATSYCNVGIVYQATGRSKEAEEAYQAGLATWKTLAKMHPEVAESQNEPAIKCSTQLAMLFEAAGRNKDAATTYEQAVAILKIQAEKHPASPGDRQQLAAAYYNLACLCAKAIAEKNASAGAHADRPADFAEASTSRAFDCLQRAGDIGLFDNPAGLGLLKHEKDLDALRSRPEYKKLLESIAARSKARS